MKTILDRGLADRARTHRRYESRLTDHSINMQKYDKRGRYVGYSLSSCVHDILNGYMPLECVVGMTTSTRIPSIEGMHKWIEGCREDYSMYGSAVTHEPFPIEEYAKVFDHILFRCRFIQYRMHEADTSNILASIPPKSSWLHGNKGYQFTPKGHMTRLGVGSWLRVDHKKFRKYLTDNNPTNDLRTKAKK